MADTTSVTPPDRPPLDPLRLHAAIAAPHSPWRSIEVVSAIASTNTELIARVDAGHDIAGSVLLAEYQSGGRGRQGRSWVGPPSSQILLSAALRSVTAAPQLLGWLPLAIGLAVVETVAAATGARAGLKWPNDVVVGRAKLAGILCELRPVQQVVVVGIGINATVRAEECPDLDAVSLSTIGAGVVDRTAVVLRLLDEVARFADRWRTATTTDELRAAYSARCVTLGQLVAAALPDGRVVRGEAREIDDIGRLVIETGAGGEAVSAVDLQHLRPVTGPTTAVSAKGGAS